MNRKTDCNNDEVTAALTSAKAGPELDQSKDTGV